MKRSLSLAMAGVLSLSIFAAGCAKQQPKDVYSTPKTDTTTPAPTGVTIGKSEGPLTVGQLPVVDGLPFWVADQKGYFKQEGVDVTLQTFNSANERDAAIMGGAIDGMLADPIATATLVATGTQVRINSLGLGATRQEGPMGIVAAPNSGIKTVADLKGVEIAISNGSVMDYDTEKMLTDKGLTKDQIKTTPIANISIRYDSLISGKIKAAILPEPWLSMAADPKKGTTVVIRDDDPSLKLNYSLSVIDFTQKSMQSKPNAIKHFFIAYNRAVEDIRLNPQGFQDLLKTQGKVPAEALALYKNVPPSVTQAPKKEDLESVVQWLVDRKIIKAPLTYEQLVDTSLLPGQGK